MVQISRFRTVFTGVAGAPWYNNLYFEGGTPEGAAYGEAVATFWDECASQMDSEVSWVVEPTYTVIETDTGLIQDIGDWAGDTGVGSVAGEALPWACQGIINWRTNLYIAGRELRGKTFVPALQQNANNNGVLVGTAVADLLGAAENLISNSNSAFCVYSRTHLTEAIVESAQVPLKIGVLRSRRD